MWPFRKKPKEVAYIYTVESVNTGLKNGWTVEEYRVMRLGADVGDSIVAIMERTT